MQKINRFYYVFILAIVLASCSDYQRVLNRGTVQERYKKATDLYIDQKYRKALVLFEKIIPSYRGKPQLERIQYMVANANYNLKNYNLSAYYFKRFVSNYPKSSKAENASFLSALSFYKSAPKFSLDPTETKKAVDALQNFIDKYPSSSKIKEANQYYKNIRARLEKKSFEIAKTYYRTADYDYRNYKAAITAFDNLLSDYLGTQYREEALYLRFKTYHDYAIKSTFRRKSERLKDAIKAYDKLKRNFPKSEYLKESDKLLSALQKEQKRINEIVKS